MNLQLALWLVGAAAGVAVALYEGHEAWADWQAQRPAHDPEIRVLALAALLRVAAAGTAATINLAIGVLVLLGPAERGLLRLVFGPGLLVTSYLLLAILTGEAVARLARRRLQRPPKGMAGRRKTDGAARR